MRRLSYILFAGIGCLLAFLFAATGETALNPELVHRLGIAVTLWASLAAAYDFAVTEASEVESWFAGLNVTLLGVSVLSCFWALHEASNNHENHHMLAVGFVLLLYVGWASLATSYYKSRSPKRYEAYNEARSVDVLILFGFITAAFLVAPLMLSMLHASQEAGGHNPGLGSDSGVKFLSAGFICLLLSMEIFKHFLHSPRKLAMHARAEILSVAEGYRIWAKTFDQSNAVMEVERRHTNFRLAELDLRGRIVDLGCGTGHYTRKLLDAGASVLAIDPCLEMLDLLKQKVGSAPQLLEILNDHASHLRLLPRSSISGILCCLVIDHLRDDELRDMLQDAHRALRPGGWIYITDVNPYFEIAHQKYAKFLDAQQMQRMIEVFPHTFAQMRSYLSAAGFTNFDCREETVTTSDAARWPELLRMPNYPLIIEYSATKKSRAQAG